MARLPQVGGDTGNWGEVLNEYLSQTHSSDGSLKPGSVGQSQIADGAVTAAKLTDDSVTTAKLADNSVTAAKLQGAGQASGIATLDVNGILPEAQVPERLSASELSSTFVGLVQAAKNPDLLIVGAVTVASDLVTSAAVVWPDGTPGTFTVTSRQAGTDAVLAYNITYGSPATRTFTQPAITRNSNGVATNVPQIVVT